MSPSAPNIKAVCIALLCCSALVESRAARPKRQVGTNYTTTTQGQYESTTYSNVICKSQWSSWINKDGPTTGDGDREMWSKEEKEAFCERGNITGIECQTDSGITSYSTGEIMQCTIEGGSVCLNDDNFPIPCSDYKIRYFCRCDVSGSTVPVQPRLSTPTPAPCQSRWSKWVNKDSPTTGDGDREIWTKAEQTAFCARGHISDIECETDNGVTSQSTGEIVLCTIEGGSVCLNDVNFPVPCSDYKIKYFCTCPDTITAVMNPSVTGHSLLTSETTLKPTYGDHRVSQTTPRQPFSTAQPSKTSATVPVMCQEGWSTWINRDSPNNGTGDIEKMTQHEISTFCSGGTVTMIECTTTDGTHSLDTGEVVSCSVNTGLECLNTDNFPIPCSDYKVRYFCSCVRVTTLPPSKVSTLTPTTMSTSRPDNANTNKCNPLLAPSHGTIACGADFPFYSCTASCDAGYHFPSGMTSDKRECDQMFGEWFDPPGKAIPDCVQSTKNEPSTPQTTATVSGPSTDVTNVHNQSTALTVNKGVTSLPPSKISTLTPPTMSTSRPDNAMNISSETCKPRLVFEDKNQTIGYFTITDNGEMCRNLQPLADFMECSGQCGSRSTYSHVMRGFTSTCNCCQVIRSVARIVTLTCKSGRRIQMAYVVPIECGCSPCLHGQK